MLKSIVISESPQFEFSVAEEIMYNITKATVIQSSSTWIQLLTLDWSPSYFFAPARISFLPPLFLPSPPHILRAFRSRFGSSGDTHNFFQPPPHFASLLRLLLLLLRSTSICRGSKLASRARSYHFRLPARGKPFLCLRLFFRILELGK